MIRSAGHSAEFALAVACSAWPPTEAVDGAVAAAAAASLDWPAFTRIVGRQRIAGLAVHALGRTGVIPPPAITAELKLMAARAAIAAVGLGTETLRLQALFEGAAIPVLFVKGAGLAQSVYGDIGIRHCRDIDLLVSQNDLDAALSLLGDAGYRPLRPLPAAAQRALWLRFEKNCELINAAGQVVEVHWRLTNNPELLRGVSAHSPGRRIELIAGETIQTLRPDLLLIYLCVHGAVHGWMRLKWLADVRAQLSGLSPEAIEALHRSAAPLGAARAVAQAIMVCQHVYGDGHWSQTARRQSRSLSQRLLARVAIASLDPGGDARELNAVPLGHDRVQASHFLLADSVAARLRELDQKVFSYADMADLPLPPSLQFAYPLIRIPRLLWRRLGRHRAG